MYFAVKLVAPEKYSVHRVVLKRELPDAACIYSAQGLGTCIITQVNDSHQLTFVIYDLIHRNVVNG